MKKTLLVVVLVLLFVLVGCQKQEPSVAVGPEIVEEVELIESEDIEVENKEIVNKEIVTAVQEDPSIDIPTKLSEFSIDIDEDGVEENIVLYTSAERDTKGQMMWDDGQQWLLVVEDDAEYYTLFKDYIQLGQGYYEVYYDINNIFNIDFIVSAGAGTIVTTFTYDKEQSVFTEKIVYENLGQNKMFSSIAFY